MSPTSHRRGLALLPICFAACGSSASSLDAGTFDAASADASIGALAVFQPPAPGAGAAWGALPYPSDLYLDTNGRLALTSLPVGPAATPAKVLELREGLATLDGAGVRSHVFFPVAAAVVPASLPAAAHLVDLDASAPGAIVEIPSEAVWNAALSCVVVALPRGTVLKPDHRYAAYLTQAAEVVTGGVLGAPPELVAAIRGDASDPAIAAARASLQPLLDVLPADVRGELASATVFRTADLGRETLAMRDAVAASPPVLLSVASTRGPGESGPDGLEAVFGAQDPDVLPGQINSAPRNQPHGEVALVVQLVIEVPDFLSASPGTDGFPSFDGEGRAVVKGRHPLHVTLTLPRTRSWADLPVILYAHGLGRTRQDMLTQANTAARHGAAMMAVDFGSHGSRLLGGGDTRNDLTGTPGADGFGDHENLPALLGFFHQSDSGGIPANHPLAIAENMRRAAIEQAALVEWIASGDLGVLHTALLPLAGLPGTLSFSGEVGVLSESLGGILAGVTIAIEPRIGVAYLAASAGGFPAPSLTSSPNYSGQYLSIITGPFDVSARVEPGDVHADRDPLIMLYGNVIERGDALAYAPSLADGAFRGGSVPDLVMAMHVGDVWVANDTQEGYARALGLPFVPFTAAPVASPLALPRYVTLETRNPPVSGNAAGRTRALVAFHPAGHTALRNLTEFRNFDLEFPPFVPLSPEVEITPTQMGPIHELWGQLMADRFAGRVPVVDDPYVD